MFNTLKRLFCRHKYELVSEQVIPRSFTNVLSFKNGKPTSKIKDINYRKVKAYICKKCGTEKIE